MTIATQPDAAARLDARALRLAYAATPVLRGVDLQLQGGELVGLIGPNGSGKSSLLRALSGQLPCEGTVHVDGIDLHARPVEARRRLGVAVEPERLPASLRVRQCIELVAHTRGLDRTAIEAGLSLSHTLGLQRWLEHEVGDCSLGTRQKLAVVLALLGDPPLLLLDEVLNGLDPLAAYALKSELRRRADAGAAVLLATHGLEVAERFLDRAVLLLDGVIAADWNRTELARLRREGDGLEAAVVERLRAAAR
ncbi:ATP-binding cassette domain-containing protein [Chiayiivirga flava]|uniref:ABC-2 type transport system ATP-binding protein n=1 Tax=Chiayiivirga flava TaxID=659595 RepID=A0A7W8D4B4_9GAMM|nr:ABC transporter ATP-binding protein [Chiayiivirga flava]MBB5207674.1 ABC-2 type transport system ATP-binding protein [Chiayiivirga flava]